MSNTDNRVSDHVQQALSTAPQLTPDQLQRIARLLRPGSAIA